MNCIPRSPSRPGAKGQSPGRHLAARILRSIARLPPSAPALQVQTLESQRLETQNVLQRIHVERLLEWSVGTCVEAEGDLANELFLEHNSSIIYNNPTKIQEKPLRRGIKREPLRE